MPIYRYRCPDCHNEDEQLLFMEDRDKSLNCKCGGKLERLMSVVTFKMKQRGRDMVLDTLNREHKILPPKQVEIMSGGLDPPPVPVTGRGFG